MLFVSEVIRQGSPGRSTGKLMLVFSSQDSICAYEHCVPQKMMPILQVGTDFAVLVDEWCRSEMVDGGLRCLLFRYFWLARFFYCTSLGLFTSKGSYWLAYTPERLSPEINDEVDINNAIHLAPILLRKVQRGWQFPWTNFAANENMTRKIYNPRVSQAYILLYR